ncbi:MAG: ClpXP protease specificity-enhancing factor SspB [Rickettsiales bacterium]|nr:ClpXP protease specificity-enhancing factor SspB [Rickettsiales bacterium]
MTTTNDHSIMTDDLFHYPSLIDHAMRGLVRDVLKRVAAHGLTGDHHFYISFNTEYPGVRISEQLKARYPNEITIVLQHQFWDFKIEEHQFHVTLSFSGVPEKLLIPFAALTAFADPSVKFGLQFQPTDDLPMNFADANIEQEMIEPVEGATDDGSAEVISLDAFRKK